MAPCLDQVGAYGEHGLALVVIETFRLQAVDRVKFALAFVNNRERRVPAPFEFGRHEPVGRVDCVVLSLRMRSLIARLLQRQFDLPPLLAHLHSLNLDRSKRRLDAEQIQTMRASLGRRLTHRDGSYSGGP